MLDLVVLRAREPQALASFYSKLGLYFCAERHGSGPEHMACDTGRGVLEIYPYTDGTRSTRAVRLGFRVTAIDERCSAITATGGRLVRAPRPSPWGKRATVEDPEGHILDLIEVEFGGREVLDATRPARTQIARSNDVKPSGGEAKDETD